MEDLMREEIRTFRKVFSLDKQSDSNLEFLLINFLERLPNLDLSTFIEQYKKEHIY